MSPLTAEQRVWLTAEVRFGVLATIASDGSPSLSVMWALLEPDGSVLMNTRHDRAKARHLRRDPRASLCFSDGYRYVTLKGLVRMRADPDLTDIVRLRDAYGDDYDFSGQRGQRVSLVMSVTAVLSHLRRL
ncbi:MAG: TIGR03618 family F420-dependent PPOX class oxidoreductase [Chloroflexi bacterium]|nr:TIGR03618 family F420-dependent PPOX class oxidoreductase [Chloroflexota bacterium]